MLARNLVLLFVLLGFSATAFSFEVRAKDLRKTYTLGELINRVSYVTGDKYYSSRTAKSPIKVKMIGTDITRENADTILTSALIENDLSRVKQMDGVYRIVPIKHLSFSHLENHSVNDSVKPKLPKTYDFHIITYKVKNRGLSKIVENDLKNLVSRNGKIINVKDGGMIIVQDYAINLDKIYRVLSKIDQSLNV